MAINTDGLPSNIDETASYVINGKTLSKLLKKAKQKLVFSEDDFDTSEDDTRLVVGLRNGGGTANTPYTMGDNRTTSDPTPADDDWDIDNPPEGTDGVVMPAIRYYNDFSTGQSGTLAKPGGGTVAFYTYDRYYFWRPTTKDSTGRVIYIGPEEAVMHRYTEINP